MAEFQILGSFSDQQVICFNDRQSSARTVTWNAAGGNNLFTSRKETEQCPEDTSTHISASVRQKLTECPFCEYSGYCLQSVMKRKPYEE